MIFWRGEGSRRAGAGLRFAEEWAAEEILDQVGSRLAAGRGLLDIKICMPTRQGIVCGRLKASRSRRRVTVCTPRRRGVPFTRVRRRGLRSMSGHPAYAWGNPPTLRRSSFPQRALCPAGGPIPKHAWGCAPRPPNAKLRLDTNWTFQQMLKSRSVRRRRYALKVPAAHFILDLAGTELK